MSGIHAISKWLHERKEKEIRDEQHRLNEQKQKTQKLSQHRQRMLQFDLDRLQAKLAELKSKLANSPPVYVHYRFDNSSRERCLGLLAQCEEKQNFITSNFTREMKFFGNTWISLFCLGISLAIGYLWVQSHLGMDAIGGSEILTVLITVTAVVLLDLFSILLIKGLLVSLKYYFRNKPRRYLTIQTVIITISCGCGLIIFIINIFQRLMEAGV
ncbi:MAG: hypothetical protein U9R02_06900 [Thermodesulfobacteriota bacterium]|nr:hypothetical protein [Thermodesulfobacteriota bacterium]